MSDSAAVPVPQVVPSSWPTAEDARPAGATERSKHGPVAQLLIALAPLSVIPILYGIAAWLTAPLAGDPHATNRLGRPLHISGPANLDRAVFGEVPPVAVQRGLTDGIAQWYDVLASIVYVSHFLAIPALTAIVWFRWRPRYREWVVAVLVFTFLGIAGYLLYPAAPPWMASELGEIGPVTRISGLGWTALDLDFLARLTTSAQGVSNPVAAMPSLHAASTVLVTLFAWRQVGALWRTTLVAYVLAMAITLVYTGEHYVADIVAGWAVAGVAVAAAAVVRRRAAGRRPRPSRTTRLYEEGRR